MKQARELCYKQKSESESERERASPSSFSFSLWSENYAREKVKPKPLNGSLFARYYCIIFYALLRAESKERMQAKIMTMTMMMTMRPCDDNQEKAAKFSNILRQ